MCTLAKSLRVKLAALRLGKANAMRQRYLFRVLKMRELKRQLAYWKQHAETLRGEA
jgi:hypothetical protein